MQVGGSSLATALAHSLKARNEFLQLQALQLTAAIGRLPQVSPSSDFDLWDAHSPKKS